MPQRRDNARVQVLAYRNSCCRSVELSRLHYHTARLICNCIVYTYFHNVPDLLSGFRVNGIAVFATNFRISIALQIICVANCDAIPVKLLPVCMYACTCMRFTLHSELRAYPSYGHPPRRRCPDKGGLTVQVQDCAL